MKVYVLIPLHHSRLTKIKERDFPIMRSGLTQDYSERFGLKNEYYIDLASQKYSISDRKLRNYNYDCGRWYYTALDPHDVIKKKAIKIKEV
jgi:hypothetical protein